MTDKSIEDDLTLAIEPDDAASKPVEIAIEGDKAEVVETAADAGADKPAAPTDPLATDEGIASLKEQLAAERRRADDATAEKARLANEASQARVDVIDSRYQQVVSAVEKAKRDGDEAEAAYAKAIEAGDSVSAAKAQRLMVRVENNLTQLESVKAQFEEYAKRGTKEGRVEPKNEPKDEPPARQLTPAENLEAFAGSLSKPSGDWVRAHPEYVQDEALNADMIAAHKHALRNGLAADTPQYFAFIEKRLGIGHDDGADAPAGRVAPSAPVTRDAPSLNGTPTGRQTITLTPEERATARDIGMTDIEYAREKAKIEADKRSGKLN